VIEWFSWLQIGIAVLTGVTGVALGLAGRKPSDVILGALALVEVLLIAQLVVAIIAPFVGNSAVGDPLEFYVYLVSAILLPLVAGFWALIERTKWSTVIVGVICLAVAVMVFRMNVIWLAPTG
jgi:hypothetical protein